MLDNIHQYGLDVENREIYLTSDFENHKIEINERVTIQFIKNLHYLNKLNQNPIVVHLMSNGGDYDAGLAIYDTITQSESPICIIGYASCCSIASLIIQAAQIRLLTPNCIFMIHEPFFATEGSIRKVWAEIDFNKQISQKMIDIYSKRSIDSIKSRNFIEKTLSSQEEIYLTAKEALVWHLIDDVFPSTNYQNINQIKEKLKN